MSKITPHLWFNKEAVEASKFYCSIFPNSKITSTSQIKNTPSGDCDIVSFKIADQPFMAISAGPVFKINPSISFFLNFDPSSDPSAKENMDKIWQSLAEGGKVLMPLQKYPFSEHYGWIEDRFGVSWQLILTNPAGEPRPFVVPSLLFTQKAAGRAEEAINFYTSVFSGNHGESKIGTMAKYPKGMEPNKEGTLMFADFCIMDTWIAAMDSAADHKFIFNEAVSLLISCESQEEIDYYWEKLSADPKFEQCGWLKDKFGVSWQVSSKAMGEMMSKGTPEQAARVTKAFMQMKKFNLAELQKAFDGK